MQIYDIPDANLQPGMLKSVKWNKEKERIPDIKFLLVAQPRSRGASLSRPTVRCT